MGRHPWVRCPMPRLTDGVSSAPRAEPHRITAQDSKQSGPCIRAQARRRLCGRQQGFELCRGCHTQGGRLKGYAEYGRFVRQCQFLRASPFGGLAPKLNSPSFVRPARIAARLRAMAIGRTVSSNWAHTCACSLTGSDQVFRSGFSRSVLHILQPSSMSAFGSRDSAPVVARASLLLRQRGPFDPTVGMPGEAAVACRPGG